MGTRPLRLSRPIELVLMLEEISSDMASEIKSWRIGWILRIGAVCLLDSVIETTASGGQYSAGQGSEGKSESRFSVTSN